MLKASITTEWRCQRCGTRYTADVGECGQNQPFECREQVIEVMAPTTEAIEVACRAYDDDWYTDKDHTPEGEATWDLMEQVLRAVFDDSDGFATLLVAAQVILDRHYPETIFPGPFREDADPGAQLVVALRACTTALHGEGRDS